MKNTSEISKADENELFSAAKRRITNFPFLTKIYDDEYLKKIIQHKRDYDNLLLFWLVIDNPVDGVIAQRLFKDIEKDLELFQSDCDFNILKSRLRHWDTIAFESAITELEFAAEYCRKGYRIELEPFLPNNKKGDFCASNECTKIFFEVKMIYKETSIKDQAIINELSERCSEMNEPYRIGIDIKKDCKRRQTAEVSKYIQHKLREIQATSINFPFSFDYVVDGHPIVTVTVYSSLSDGETGCISGFTYGGGVKVSWKDLRSKISSGVSQLHPDYPGVLIVRPYGLDTLEYDIRNALFADLSARPNSLGKLQVFRSGDRIFDMNKNKRLSAVIYYDKRLNGSEYAKKKVVYHNPFAAKKLPAEILEGENVM